jgi:O-antigen/teichoic acid export membrane protein
LLLVGCSLVFYGFDSGLKGLIYSYVIAELCVAIIAAFLFPHYFSYAKLIYHIRHFRLFKPLLSFAIPQNLNMTFNTLITNLDVLMLGYFGCRESDIFIYGMGAQLVRNIRQVKLALSSSFAPLIAKFHEQNNLFAMNDSFSMVSRWIISLGLPLALVVGLLRLDLLRLFDAGYAGDTRFMLLLLAPPLLSCGFGLAGNIVVMTGHAKWNLLNSITVASINTVLNLVFIPKWGMIGAAAATTIAAFCISMLQLVEVYHLVGTHLILKQVYKPWVAVVPATLSVLVLHGFISDLASLWGRIILTVLGVVIYTAVLIKMGVEERDKRALIPWYKESSTKSTSEETI